ncbi:hypothetical protein C3497_14115 [Zoogloeaceae bacteirum Par-f-2]|nr:hypothetical protein C3497_14115 [Zoogloeaceae bacteirum Par-f-2]
MKVRLPCLQYAFGSASKRAWRLRYLAHRDAGGMRMARDLEADRLVFWQTPEEEGAGGNEIASWLINLDLDFDAGEIDADELIKLREMLAQSPWRHDAEFVRWCRATRKELGHPPERFWWWPEHW